MSGWQETGGGTETPEGVSVYPPQPRMAEYRPLRRTATLTRVSLALIALASIVAAVFDVAERSLLARVESGEPVSFGELSASDDRQLAVSAVVVLLWIVTTIFFIVWLHRAYANLSALGVADLRFGTGWAIGAWFVPFLNLVRPIQIVNDVWRGSHPYLADRLGWRGRPVPRVFGFWWGAWLLGTFVGGVAGRLLFAAEDTRGSEASATVFIASDILTAVAAILAMVVVDKTTARQAASAARAVGGEQPAPPTQWLRGRRRLAVAAAVCALAAGAGALAVAGQPTGSTPSSDGGAATTGPDSDSDSETLSLTDDFSDPGSGWSEEEGDGVSYRYDDGEYRMTVTTPHMTWFSLFGLGFVVDPIRIEADTRLVGPASDEAFVGIGCFVTDLYGYFGAVWPDGYYGIYLDPVDTEDFEPLVEGTDTNAIGGADETNRVGLLCESGPPAIITLTVGGRTVAEARHDEGLGAFEVAGLLTGSGPEETTAYFDNFEVTSPSGR